MPNDVDRWLALLPEDQRKQLAGGSAANFNAFVSEIVVGGGQPIKLPHPGVTVVVGGNNVGKSTLLRQIVSNWQFGGRPFLILEPRVLTGMAANTEGSTADVLAWLQENRHPRLDAANQYITFGSATTIGMSASTADVASVIAPIEGGVRRELASHLIRDLDLERRKRAAGETAKGSMLVGGQLDHPAQIFEVDKRRRRELNKLSREAFEADLTFDNLGATVIPRVGKLTGKSPRVDELDHKHWSRMQRLPPLASQGAGMVHMLGLMMDVLAATYPVLVIDEPEAFLHPPQARILGQALGKQAMAKGVQIILGTHNRNVLVGLLDVAGLDLSILRLTRKGLDTAAVELRAKDARELWRKPIVLYGDLLEGLFHRLVVLCEAEGDCLFYAAAMDAAHRKGRGLGLNPRDVLFLPSHGVAGMNKLAQILRSAGVAVVSSPDIDVLRREDLFEFVKTMDGDEALARRLVKAATSGMNNRSSINTCGDVLHKLNKLLAPQKDEQYTNAVKREVGERMRAEKDPWEAAKKHGTNEIAGDVQKLDELLDLLMRMGIVVVRAGELESFGHGSSLRKHDGWAGAAIEKGLHKRTAVREHVRRLVEAGLALGA